MTIHALQELAALIKERPGQPLDTFRSLLRVHHHQLRAGIRPWFPIQLLGSMIGIEKDVIIREDALLKNEVGRAYRAVTNGNRTDLRGIRGRPQRYVTEDGRIITF